MHSLGIIGFPRRIYDYTLLYFKFQWFNSFGFIGIYLSIITLLMVVLVSMDPIPRLFGSNLSINNRILR
jgi:heme/copper-type cytochrome/quinol oxidase subunit 1